jgi:hypothetical protein
MHEGCTMREGCMMQCTTNDVREECMMRTLTHDVREGCMMRTLTHDVREGCMRVYDVRCFAGCIHLQQGGLGLGHTAAGAEGRRLLALLAPRRLARGERQVVALLQLRQRVLDLHTTHRASREPQ